MIPKNINTLIAPPNHILNAKLQDVPTYFILALCRRNCDNSNVGLKYIVLSMQFHLWISLYYFKMLAYTYTIYVFLIQNYLYHF